MQIKGSDILEIDQLVALITKQVRERLEAFESRKRVLMLGSCEAGWMEKLNNMFESNGFSFYNIDMHKREPDIEKYAFVLLTREKFCEMQQQVNSENGYRQTECKTAAPEIKTCIIDKRIITEQDILKLAREGCSEAKLCKKAIITPLALDSAKVGGIRLVRE